MIGGIGAVISFSLPHKRCSIFLEKLKFGHSLPLWGTIDPMRVIESNFLDGNLSPAVKQILYLISAFMGAHMGTELVKWVCGGGRG